MFNRLIIAVLTIGLLITFSSTAISSNDAPKSGFNEVGLVNQDAPRFHDMGNRALDMTVESIEKPAGAAHELPPSTTALPPELICTGLPYDSYGAALFWTLPDEVNPITLYSGHCTPPEGYSCTLLTISVGLYGPANVGNPGMRVYLFDAARTKIDSIDVTPAEVAATGFGWQVVDFSTANGGGPYIFEDGEEFYIGFTHTSDDGADTLAFLSDVADTDVDGAYNILIGSTYYSYNGAYKFQLVADVCCGKIPFTDCYTDDDFCPTQTLYVWDIPDGTYGDEAYGMKYNISGPETLVEFGVGVYLPFTTGDPSMEVIIYGDDAGLPDETDVIFADTVAFGDLVSYPSYNVFDLSALNLVVREDIYITFTGIQNSAEDTLWFLSDDATGGCGQFQGLVAFGGAWYSFFNIYGIDVNFYTYATFCKDEFAECDVLSYYCVAGAVYTWELPDPYGDIGMYQRFTPLGEGCRLETVWLLLWPDVAPYYTHNSEFQIFGADQVTLLPNPADVFYTETVTPADYAVYPSWMEFDLTTLPDEILFDRDIWIGMESFGPEGEGIVMVSDKADICPGGLRSAENWAGTFGYMLDDWGIDVNFLIEAAVCCVPFDEETCAAGDQWPTAGKTFNRISRSLSSMGADVQGNLTKAWEYSNTEGNASLFYTTPAVWNDTIVGYFFNNLVAIDLNDGSEIWKRIPDLYSIGGDTRVSPTIFDASPYGDDTRYIYAGGGSNKSFFCVELATGDSVWTRNLYDHNFENVTWGSHVIVDIAGEPILIYADDAGSVYAVNALTGALFTGWTTNPISLGGPPGRAFSAYGGLVYMGTFADVNNGDVIAIDPADGSEVWRLSTSAGYQLPNLDPDNDGPESFGGLLAVEETASGVSLYIASVYDAGVVVPPYNSGGIMYSLNGSDGSLNWAALAISGDYAGVNVDKNTLIQNGWTPWVPGFGEFRGPIGFDKRNGLKVFDNTTTNPGLGDFWLMDGVLSCEQGAPDWYVVTSRNNFAGFYRSTDGAMMFHRRFTGARSGALYRAGHRIGAVMVDGTLLVGWWNKLYALVDDGVARPRLDIPNYSIDIPVEFGLPDPYTVVFPGALGNMGGAPLTIDSVVLTDDDNFTLPPPSAALSSVDINRIDAMKRVADKFANNADAFRVADDEIITDDFNSKYGTRNNAAYAIPSWIYTTSVTPVPGTVIPSQGSYNDSSAYINITVDVNGTEVPRGYTAVYAHIFSDDPDYFLDSARMDFESGAKAGYAVPQIRLGFVGGCLYDDVVINFGAGGANYAHVWNATQVADGDILSWEIDGDDASFWQGAYIFATAPTGALPPGSGPGGPRIAHYANNWSAANPANWQSILADPNCVDATCPPLHETNVLLGSFSTDNGATYDPVYGEVVYYAFIDSVQDMCDYDTLGVCGSWDWTYHESGVQPPYNDTLTMGFHGCAAVIGAQDVPELADFVIHKFQFNGRYGDVNDVYFGAMFDYDLDYPNQSHNQVQAWAPEYNMAYAYGCNVNDRGWGIVRIPFGCGTEGLINTKTTTANQSVWNDSAVWLDSVYTWMSTLTGLSHQTGIDPVGCNYDADDREAFYTIGQLDMPDAASGDSLKVGLAVFGSMVDPGTADDPEAFAPLANIANKWCGFGRGDMNNDNKIDVVDIAYLINFVHCGGNGPYPFEYLGDVNADGVTDAADITRMVNYYFNFSECLDGAWVLLE